MASEVDVEHPLFEEYRVSASVSANESIKFLEDHGCFYQADSEIGRLVTSLDRTGLADGPDGLKSFRPTLLQDPVRSNYQINLS